jgi:hypothetical protein
MSDDRVFAPPRQKIPTPSRFAVKSIKSFSAPQRLRGKKIIF